MDPEVPEHGVQFPTAKEHDGVAVDIGAEEGGGPARAEGAGRHLFVVDAGDGFDGLGGVPESIGDSWTRDLSALVQGLWLYLDLFLATNWSNSSLKLSNITCLYWFTIVLFK